MTEEAVPRFSRRTMIAALPSPGRRKAGLERLRYNLLGTWTNAVLTLFGLALLWVLVPPVVDFLIVDAVWTGSSRDDCLAEKVGREVGACWPFIRAKLDQLIYGFYPAEQRWRVNLAFAVGAALLVPLLVPRAPYKRANAFLFFVAFPIVATFLLRGGGLASFGVAWLGALAGWTAESVTAAGAGIADRLGTIAVIGSLFAGAGRLVSAVGAVLSWIILPRSPSSSNCCNCPTEGCRWSRRGPGAVYWSRLSSRSPASWCRCRSGFCWRSAAGPNCPWCDFCRWESSSSGAACR